MNKDCEIGSLGKYVVMMSLDDLKEIANGELRAYSEELEHENSALQYKLDKAVEALKFYADESHYQKERVDSRFHSDEEVFLVEEVILDNGRIARNVLEGVLK